MKDTVTKNMFIDSFSQQYKDNFSYEGKIALFEHLTDWEADTGDEIELDTIGLCCEFTEFENFEEFKESYRGDFKDIEDITESTTVIIVDDDRFIIENF